MKRTIIMATLLILVAGAGDLMRQQGWISQQPMWVLLGVAAAFGVALGGWLRKGQP